MSPLGLEDGVIRLRRWTGDDASWYAECVRDPEIQRFTTDPPTLDSEQVLAAIVRLRNADNAEGFVICVAITGVRLGNIAVLHDGRVGEVSYWLAAEARGRGASTRVLSLFSSSAANGCSPAAVDALHDTGDLPDDLCVRLSGHWMRRGCSTWCC